MDKALKIFELQAKVLEDAYNGGPVEESVQERDRAIRKLSKDERADVGVLAGSVSRLCNV